MKIRNFESKIKNFPAFNLNDICKLDPGFHRQQLSYWKNKGYVKALAGGYYALSDRTIDEAFLFMVANKLYEPSYISLESVLAYYQIIPESVIGVTSVSSRKTKQFESPWGVFSYRSLKPSYLFGYQVVETNQGIKFKIAELEKAILDYLYLNSSILSTTDFEGLRWNREQLHRVMDISVFYKYLVIFNKIALENRVKRFVEYLNA